MLALRRLGPALRSGRLHRRAATRAEDGDPDEVGVEAQRKVRLLRNVLRRYGDKLDFLPGATLYEMRLDYLSALPAERSAYIDALSETLAPDYDTMARAARRFLAAHDSDPDAKRGTALEKTHRRLEAASRHPIRRWMARVFSESGSDGLLFLMHLREDVLGRLSEELRGTTSHRHLRALDATMADTLAQWFVPGVLELHRITFASPGLFLERIRDAERVHRITGLVDFKRRIGNGRRCFAFTHPSLPLQPLAVLHVALTPELADGLPYIDRVTGGEDDGASASCAVFYSISNASPSLKGVVLGPTLIKRATAWLLEHEPQVEAFSTLSPIPNFAAWLQLQFALREREGSAVRPLVPPGSSQLEEAPWLDGTADGGSKARLSRADHALQSALCLPRWEEREDVAPMVRPVLLRLCALYLQCEKNHGRSLCPVANFHLGNGAELHRINWMGNPSVAGMEQSYGLMVNYRYDLPNLTANSTQYTLEGAVVTGSQVQSLLRDEEL